jgi:REP element-mobilizing transposase RayT
LKENHFDPTLHHRRSLRLPGYNYAAKGAYFITICLDEPQPLLLNPELRAIVEETWNALPQRFPTIALDEFIIMPDHLHFIVWLHPNKESHPALGRVVGAYKSLTARAALTYLRTKGLMCGHRFWQRNFHEHVIRNEADLQEKRVYIRNNPIKDDLKHHRL